MTIFLLLKLKNTHSGYAHALPFSYYMLINLLQNCEKHFKQDKTSCS